MEKAWNTTDGTTGQWAWQIKKVSAIVWQTP